jgi:hypothetical protein
MRVWVSGTNLRVYLADGVGFEPTRPLRACRFSRPVPSTARPPIQLFEAIALFQLACQSSKAIATGFATGRLTLAIYAVPSAASIFAATSVCIVSLTWL